MSDHRRRGTGWWRRLATPQMLVAVLVFLASAGFFLAGRGPRVGKPTPVDVKPPQQSAQTHSQEVRLVLVDSGGLARPHFVTLDLPEDPAAQFEVILGALRKQMAQDGSWPQNLATPDVYVQQANRTETVVVDMRETAPVAVGVSQELQLLHSIRQTVLGNGADEVRFLRDGRPTATFLGHVAVDTGM